MKKNDIVKYFNQKNRSAWETVLVGLIVVFGFVVSFVPNGGPIGGPALIGVIIIFVCVRTLKVKDQIIDEHIQTLLKENGFDESTTAVALDFRHPATRKGKDHQLRSPLLWAVQKKAGQNESVLTVTRLNLMDSQVSSENYLPSHLFTLEERWITTPAGDKKCWFLTGDCLAEQIIPVNMSNAHCARLVEQILQTES